MKLNELLADDRAISPVVGVALLIGITVILAAVIGGVVLGIGVGPTEAPSAQLNAQLDSSSSTYLIEHNGGEPLEQDEVIVRVAGTDENLNGDFTAGNTLNMSDGTGFDSTPTTPSSGDTVTIIWQDPEGDSETVISEFEVE